MKSKQAFVIILTLSLCAALCSCSLVEKAIGVKLAVPTANSSPPAAQASEAVSASALSTAAAPAQSPVESEGGVAKDPIRQFIDAFRTVDQSPIDPDLQLVMYLESKETPPVQTANPTGSLLADLAAKYAALVDGPGIHYTDSALALGMDMKAEHWVKAGKFKKVDALLNEVTIFDGTDYYQYDIETKKGKKLPASEPVVMAAIKTEAEGMLPMLAVSPYEQQKDEKSGKFDCNVFTIDIEVMGMKGNTIYIDKNTGMLVKNVYGDPKDKKNSIATTVLTLDTAGFGDDVFTVPADITFE
jgi:hypothetical protein